MGKRALINWNAVARFMSILLVVNGVFMFAVSIFSFITKEDVFQGIFFSSLALLVLGAIGIYSFKQYEIESLRREGYIIVTFGWILMALTGTLPYITSGVFPSFTDAFFETMSGYTTVGASVMQDVEQVPHGVLLWRSITQWIGGMGMIVLAIAILPMLGVGGMQLFAAEAPVFGEEKLHPRITDTAKRLWLIYIGFTVLQAILLKLAGMSVFDAVNHAFTTLSTGGFSTKNDSIAFYNDLPLVQLIVMLFMFLGGMNFVLSYHALKGRFNKVFADDEFKMYLIVLFSFSIIVLVFMVSHLMTTENKLIGFTEIARHAAFQTVSIITTTGFVSTPHETWSTFISILFFALMFLGGSAQSTSGGIKLVRHLILLKNGVLEFRRAFHPRAILPVRYNKRAVDESIVSKILAFFTLFMITFVVGVLVFTALGIAPKAAIASVASTLGNVGGAYGELNSDFIEYSVTAKWWAAFLMLLGRLELFTVLILFTPYFWKKI